MKCVKAKGIPVLVYEPTMTDGGFFGSEVTHVLEGFRRWADAIVANRWSDELSDVRRGCILATCPCGINSLSIQTLQLCLWSDWAANTL